MNDSPLKGLRVANFGWVWSAPVVAHLMADMGAEVIKIETKKRVDLIRAMPPFLNGKQNESLYAHNAFRSQRSITLDLSHPDGVHLALDLVRNSDVVIENFRPGTMERYGLDYKAFRIIRPDVVMLSLATAGQNGPLCDLTSYGVIITTMAGVDGVQGYPGERPLPIGTAIADPTNGMMGLFAVMAAVRHRSRTGEGQYIDLSQWETMATTVGGPWMDYLLNKRLQQPIGNHDPMMAPHGVYKSRGHDHWVTIAVKTDDEWKALCHVIGRPDLVEDERFGDLYARQSHQVELDKIIADWTASRENYEAARLLQEAGVAAFPALSSRELFDDPHFNERECWVKVDHAYGPEVIYNLPWKFSDTPGKIRWPCRLVGQDNDYVLNEVLGLPGEDIKRLEESMAVY